MKQVFIRLMLVLCCSNAQAQVKIAAGASIPHSSAILDVESSSRGVLLPRMTSAQRSSISNPATGLVIYNTSLGCVELYNGNAWGYLDFTYTPVAAAIGSTYTSPHGSAATAFSTNSNCSSSMISAGYKSGNCYGSVTVGGNSYAMVYINGQCWMQTNLKEAPSNYSYNNTWLNDKNYSPDSARYGYYNTSTADGSAGFQATEPAAGEGYIYQWNAAMNGSRAERAQGVCPNGWHIPSDCEWMYLEHGLGMSVADQTINGQRFSGNVGSQLSLLTSGGNNSTGFTGILSGYRLPFGFFSNRGSGNPAGYFWSSTAKNTSDAYHRALYQMYGGVYRTDGDRAFTYSVRCLRD